MSPIAAIGWVVFAYVLWRGLRYLLVVRLFLTCAHRDARLTRLTRQQLEPGHLELLSQFDAPLAAAGFRQLGFAQLTPVLTYYDKAQPCSVFVNEVIPAYAFVRPRSRPSYGAVAELQIQTTLESGITVATFNTPLSSAFVPPDMRAAADPAVPIATLVELHQYRLAQACVQTEPVKHTGFDDALDRLLASLAGLRAYFRERACTVATSDSSLDRYTLLGAVVLTHKSLRVIGASRKGTRSAGVSWPNPLAYEQDRQLLIEADLFWVRSAAEHPETAPGTPWALITVIIATAVLSWVAMAWVWNFPVATLVLAAVAFHEAGHAVAMRLFGYRDVHVFFVPMLGAMTVGRAVNASVRDRLAVLLAGPTPGLWLGLLLAAVDQAWFPSFWLRAASRVLLILNGLNLLPFTPLDGGRALELLSRPESIWRVVVHIASALGLVALAVVVRDPLFALLGFLWIVLFPRQWQAWQLRRLVAARVTHRADFCEVARATLEIATSHPRYAALQAGIRQVTARALGRAFSEAAVTPADRAWGAIAYASAWIPVGAWFLLNSPAL